ncbi:MAG: alpha-amylase family glycosyl hydrolase, partial [Treponema porcinum]|nr:alpha-amylase family glycosyl hydrolase [Treponema porcinum]
MKKGAFALFCAAAFFAGCGSGSSDGGDGVTEFGTPDKTVISSSISSEDNNVMLQGFSWESCKSSPWWNVITSNAEEIGNDFEYVWFPPCSDSNSNQGYLPRKLYVFDAKYGTKEQLKSAITAISPAKAIADVVINHRCGTTGWGDFTEPSFGTEKGVNYKAICSDDEGFKNEPAYMGKVPASMRGAEDTGESYAAGRDLDHTNSDVQNGIIVFLGKLKDLGFCGWRYDFVKGYAGKYVGMYNKETGPVFSVGEYWPTAGYSSSNPNAWGNAIKSWVAETASDGGQYSCAFDFALKGAINTVFGNKTTNAVNSHYNLLADESNLMISNPEAAVTFVDNHDTGSTQKHWYTD